MQVTVTFLGTIRDQVGRPSLTVELPDAATYRDLLGVIGPLMESSLAEWAWDTAGRTFSRRIMASRNMVGDLRDESTPLADGDEIVVLLPLAGG